MEKMFTMPLARLREANKIVTEIQFEIDRNFSIQCDYKFINKMAKLKDCIKVGGIK